MTTTLESTVKNNRRTDIHRPSAPEFDPEGYDLLGVYDLHPDPLYGAEEIRARRERVAALVAEGWSFRGAPHGSGQCSHCGARIRYAALMGHTATKTLLYVGETCLDNRFSLTKGEFDQLRKAAALNAERASKRSRIEALLAEHPSLAYASYAHNIGVAGGVQVAYDYYEGTEYATEEAAREAGVSEHALGTGYKRGTTWGERARQDQTLSTLGDIWYKVERYADVSEKQVAYVERLLGWLDEAEQKRVEREAATAAVLASGVHVPEGRVTVEGEIVSIKQVEDNYSPYGGTITKVVVVTDEGWKVYGTLPSSIYDADKGDRVRFTAAVTQSDDDPLFGFYKRPTKAQKI